MNSNKCPLRAVGQRSLTSTFLFRAPNRSDDCKRNGETKAPSQKGSKISLSDFLNRKLHRGSVLPTSFEGKEKELSSSSSQLGGGQLDRGAKEESSTFEGREAETKFSIGDGFDLFKKVEKGKHESKISCCIDETEIIDVDNLQQTKKRKYLFEGRDDEPTARKRVLVLGEGTKPARSSRRKNFASEETKPLFNHYGNGGGWWDENMEGVDSEEVGCNEAWEGVGCTTLGGIEWH